MGWLKRNLFFAIGILAAAVLLIAAIYYAVSNSEQNSKDLAQLNEIYTSLQQIRPGTDKKENIDAAKRQAGEVRQWIKKTWNYFEPVARIPAAGTDLTDDTFASALHRTISELQRAADDADVQLPPQYDFSFQAQYDKVRFMPPGSVTNLAVQLGDVKTIAEVFFKAHVNALDGIQRLRVSDDDTVGPATDYIDGQPVATDLATLTPYQVTFRGFTTEINSVLAGFAATTNGFIIQNINVQPASASMDQSQNGYAPMNGYAPSPMMRNMPNANMNMNAPRSLVPQTILNEQMLRVTMLIYVVKLSPGI